MSLRINASYQPEFTCSKLATEILEQCVKCVQMRRNWRLSGVIIVNFEHVSHLVLVFYIVNFEHINAG